MNLPSDTPRLPKWIFLLGYVSLLTLAWFIHDGSDHPWSGGALLAIVVCVALAAVLIALPFVADYAHSQDEALDNRQRALQALATTVASSSEQIAIATAGLQKLTGIEQENVAQSQRAANQIQERIAELNSSLAESKKGDGDAVARLEAVAKKISKAAAELEAKAALPPEIARSVQAARIAGVMQELPPVPLSRMVEIKPAVSSSHSPFEAPAPESTSAAQAPVPEITTEPAAARKRSPRKPAPTAQAPADLLLESPSQDIPSGAAAPEISEPAVSADGATRLIVTAYIGIGNRLFIRGDGPGLSWEKGVPLVFVSIGKWRWETNDALAPVRFRLYKNDEVECTVLGERSVEPGGQQDLSAAF